MMAGIPVPEDASARLDLRWVRRSFASAASGYDGVAALQREVGTELLTRWSPACGNPAAILDVGSGTGYFTRELGRLHPGARTMAVDIAEGMLRVARSRLGGQAAGGWICGRAEALPLASASVDLVFSNLVIQWCVDPCEVFREFRRVLRPGGTLLFSSFGPATLGELRRAWATADRYSHVNRFASPAELTTASVQAGFSDMVLNAARKVLAYPDVGALMRELKGLGAHNVTAGRARHLTGKGVLKRMVEAYPVNGQGVAATYETLVGFARVAD